MYVSSIKQEYRRPRKARIAQGDILRDITLVNGIEGRGSELFERYELQYAVVMTQDCDLSEDYKSLTDDAVKKQASIPTILLASAYPAQQFFLGQHLEDWELESFNAKLQGRIKQNDQYKRYHYLKGNPVMGVPELVIDFKHFQTVGRDLLYRQRTSLYVATVNELYREELSHRFANYLSRIGLPDAVSENPNQTSER
jgi:hypothetical protein